MIDDATWVHSVLILLAWAAVVVLAYVTLSSYGKRRLVRCPESGAVTFVEASEAQAGADGSEGPPRAITYCRFWPEKNDCGTGCLSRYEQNQGLFGFDLKTLRPFDANK